MQKCPSPVDYKVLQLTNEVWNELQLNSPWSVGMVSHLIRQEQFGTYQDWYQYYYQSGQWRADAMQDITPTTRHILDFIGPRSAKIMLKEEYHDYRGLQRHYGRSRSIILHRSGILRNAVAPKLTLNQAFQIVEYRVLGETWNGIYIREKHFENYIDGLNKHIKLVHASGEMDYNYAIDYELYMSNVLICAVQVKPETYRSDKSYIRKAIKANRAKNTCYTEDYGKPVYTILIASSGEIIENPDHYSLMTILN